MVAIWERDAKNVDNELHLAFKAKANQVDAGWALYVCEGHFENGRWMFLWSFMDSGRYPTACRCSHLADTVIQQ